MMTVELKMMLISHQGSNKNKCINYVLPLHGEIEEEQPF